MSNNSLVTLTMQEPGVALISINRPEAMNALNSQVIRQLSACVDQVEANPEVKAVVIYSEKNFAAGADIAEMVELDEAGARAFVFSDVYCKLESLRVPTVAAIAGYALGGGMELALCCDFRFASEKAQMGFPEINLGIFPGAGGTVRLPRLVGESIAKEMIYLGKPVPAEKALSYGMVSRVVADDQLLQEAVAFAKKLASKAPIALEHAKRSIQFGVQKDAAFQTEMELWVKLFETKDQKEGMHAFLEKRKPVFTGRG